MGRVLQLIDEGKLARTDKLSKWFPDFPRADQITVDHLLLMRSGIADSADAGLLEFYYDHPLVNYPAEESMWLAASRADRFTDPGQVTRYTNINYNILELIDDLRLQQRNVLPAGEGRGHRHQRQPARPG